MDQKIVYRLMRISSFSTFNSYLGSGLIDGWKEAYRRDFMPDRSGSCPRYAEWKKGMDEEDERVMDEIDRIRKCSF